MATAGLESTTACNREITRPGETMTQKPITSIDVAQLAGVSQSTVSRAFDPAASVAAATRDKVFAAARALGYQPNVIARSLSTQRTNIVGVIMANLTSSLFYPRVLDVLAERLQQHGKQSLLFKVGPDRPADDVLPLVLGYQVDALVIASTTPSYETIDECTERGTPVILFNRVAPETSASSVCSDNEAGGQLVADLLLDNGHERIAFIAGIANTATNTARDRGFTGRLRERGYTDLIREQGAYTYASGFEATRRLLALGSPPDAVFCAADIMALGAIDAALAEGLKIPDDLSIAGFDDIPVAGWPSYDLTTIRQPTVQMVDKVVSLVTAPDSPIGQVHLLPGELVLRGSVRLA
jgi:DNA-binding LacI/PurR family transcriptional regulator